MLKSIAIAICFTLGISITGEHYLKSPEEYPLPEPEAQHVDMEYLQITTDAYIVLNKRKNNASKEFQNLAIANSNIFDSKQLSRQIKQSKKIK